MKKLFIFLAVITIVTSCDPNHQNEFYNISRNDIEGYEAFIKQYPSSSLVKDAKERIATEQENRRIQAEQERQAALQQQLENTYGNNSLSNGSAPYSYRYGQNLYFDDYTPHSEIQVNAPYNSDVIAIVRYNNSNGNVAGHKYICAGRSATIYLKNGYRYQTFFYYGKGWYPQKEMKNGLRGGFIKGEIFSKDGSSSYLENQILEYTLTVSTDGNFQTTSSSEGEVL